jgi:hypothetical protein
VNARVPSRRRAGEATGRARGSPGAARSLANGGDVGSRAERATGAPEARPAEHPAGRWSLRLSAERATARGAKRLKYVTFFGTAKTHPCSEGHHRPPGISPKLRDFFTLSHLPEKPDGWKHNEQFRSRCRRCVLTINILTAYSYTTRQFSAPSVRLILLAKNSKNGFSRGAHRGAHFCETPQAVSKVNARTAAA